jgi:uncharacterized protein
MSFIVDFLAVASLVGIWPRYIAPRRLMLTHLTWALEPKFSHLAGLKILHLTDLHFHNKTSQSFLKKIIQNVCQQKPDLILFTGDFLCYARLEAAERLRSFLCCLEAPLGAFCSLGNHDYARYVSLNSEGVYDLRQPPNPLVGVLKGMKTLLSSQKTGIKVAPHVLTIPMHASLGPLLASTPFKLLENATVTLPIGLNITGLGDLALGRCQPQKAFNEYDPRFPGIILSHNPDTLPSLLAYPGDWILSGHTHGEQIHIPWPKWGRKISQKLARLQNSAYTRGLYKVGDKTLYVNRGLGCHKPFRLFSPPEVCIIHIL